MIEALRNEYEPDFVTHPGESLEESLRALGMTQAELAERTGRPKKTINQIVAGLASITPETAIQLERSIGVPADFWNRRQRRYDAYRARIAERGRLEESADWTKKFPLRQMQRLGFLAPIGKGVERVRHVLDYFGVASPEAWEELWGQVEVNFRKPPNLTPDIHALAAWLRKGELEAREIECDQFDKNGFRRSLTEARHMTTERPESFVIALTDLCSRYGVAVVFVPELPKLRTSGVCRWLGPEKALIQLSLRYKTADQLWFTFFHEAGHVLLHQRKKSIYLDERCPSEFNEEEEQANAFAAGILIPESDLKSFLESNPNPRLADIESFAMDIGVAPGIVVGRLQHDGILDFRVGNGLKMRLQWEEPA